MSIRWVRNVILEGEKTILEVQFGEKTIGDKCYTRVGNELEQWFDNLFDNRDDIFQQGIDILQKRLGSKNITYPDGRAYDWK